MLRYASDFVRSRGGSIVPVFLMILVPLLLAVGLSVDYTSAVQTKSNMQNALDAAILSITTLPKTTTLADREKSLQQSFAANGGQGSATLDSFVVAADGTATAKASAHYPMPTNFMQIAKVDTVQVGVTSAVRKRPALVQTTFRVTKVSGYWNKTMTLYGTKFGDTVAKPLMTITYTYNGFGDPKGYGTAIVSTISGSTTTKVQQQVCTTATVKNFNSLPSGAITQTSGSKKYVTTCADTFYPANGTGAVIDVSQMDSLYLQMDVPSGSPKVLKSNDPTTSNRLYIGTSTTTMPEVATGQTVDIFTAVPCGQTGYQAWEDGGNPVPADVSNADFFYTVQGKCDFNQRPSNTVLTQ
ncbi:pilus assembly protein [Mesorhizobium sp. M4B.F.Ca.ET.190.01.1.1]|uniref:TadE/TadG family type IV pilus assembly protein n=1 Tax=unclassified Mesorhizobium TaxID=325217 RepID=UPI000FE7E798|nr:MULTISPECIES: TadE/TadG family type IV pilus assembly protein [unclassified Mesorhizobium]RWA58200.1 MAG: pilus assembly protein [Mesorhizobium sp.]RWF55406.1 MAG: pilus assembly protein [Mesorhizobium sp.]TGR01271.1 pilus assembly protein [Mesorhizobium sp. M4B.F.Ca.ET.200.01.1.1]TGS13087.1 pilus assembly protein [Mesorhizobium sp. M4B.F.Ca.ET.190.01.1.1]TGT25466.1 pilus assembly protein [Mesorhizobium sp. M4B.F.Ca.ET.172.01.1.1]